MRRNAGKTNVRCIPLQQLPDYFLRNAFAPYFTAPIDRTEDETGLNPSGRCPCIHRHLNPCRNWDSTDASVLAVEIDNAPASIQLLNPRSASAATSDLRKAQPIKRAKIARSRRPFTVAISGAFRSICACCSESQFPIRTPVIFEPLTRQIAEAISGASSPLSPASCASLRTAESRPLIEEEPNPLLSSDDLQAFTVDFVNPHRFSLSYHSMNSSSARLYTRRVIGDETASSTRRFNRRHSDSFSTMVSSVIHPHNWHYRKS